MVRSSFFTLAVLTPFLVSGLGCAPDFEPASTLDSVRVLGIQKDKPYARPGDTVTLQLLATDSSSAGPRPLEILWLGGFCENPPGDLYARCFERFLPKPGDPPLSALTELPPDVLQGSGPVFQLPLSRQIISGRPRPLNQRQPPYGVSFVFFTVCAGNVALAPAGELVPFACYSATGDRVDQSGFVVGYTEVFASNTITNHNPVVTGFKIDGQAVTVDCTGPSCIPPSELGPGGNAGQPPGGAPSGAGGTSGALTDAGGIDAALAEAGVVEAGTGAAPAADAGPFRLPEADPCEEGSSACIDVCTKEKPEDCKEHTLQLLVDGKSQSAEKDDVATIVEGHDVYEQAWVNYYTEAGKIPIEVKLLSDATVGFHEDTTTKILAPRKKGPFHVWAVAHDNRGGTEWVRLRMSAH